MRKSSAGNAVVEYTESDPLDLSLRARSTMNEKPLSKKAEQILDAARCLFIERGFEATTMDALAAVADVSKATVYAYHPSKEALFAATVKRECRRTVTRMTIGEHGVDGRSLEQALIEIGNTFLNILVSPEIAALTRMVVAESRRFPELGHIYYHSGPGQITKSVAKYLERANQRGCVHGCDPWRGADQFLGLLRGDRHIRLLLGQYSEDTSKDDVVREAVALFLGRYGSA